MNETRYMISNNGNVKSIERMEVDKNGSVIKEILMF